MQKSTSPSQITLVACNQAFFPPTPVNSTFTSLAPMRARKNCALPLVIFSKPLNLRQGANSASTAKESEEHSSGLQSRGHLVCRLLLEKTKQRKINHKQKQQRKNPCGQRFSSGF